MRNSTAENVYNIGKAALFPKWRTNAENKNIMCYIVKFPFMELYKKCKKVMSKYL